MYEAYLVGTQSLMLKYDVEIVAVGEGYESSHTDSQWPINGVLRFPHEQAVEELFNDPAYQELCKQHRDPAYETLRMSLFRGRAPREFK